MGSGRAEPPREKQVARVPKLMHKNLQLLCVEPTLREGGREEGREGGEREGGKEGGREGKEGGRRAEGGDREGGRE